MVLAAETDLETLKRETAPMLGSGFDIDQIAQQRDDIQGRAVEMAREGKGAIEIAQELGKPPILVRRWIEGVEGE